MLILCENGMSLYDTRSGTAIHVIPTSVEGIWQISGADGTQVATRDSEDEAKKVLRELYLSATRGDMVEEIC